MPLPALPSACRGYLARGWLGTPGCDDHVFTTGASIPRSPPSATNCHLPNPTASMQNAHTTTLTTNATQRIHTLQFRQPARSAAAAPSDSRVPASLPLSCPALPRRRSRVHRWRWRARSAQQHAPAAPCRAPSLMCNAGLAGAACRRSARSAVVQLSSTACSTATPILPRPRPSLSLRLWGWGPRSASASAQRLPPRQRRDPGGTPGTWMWRWSAAGPLASLLLPRCCKPYPACPSRCVAGAGTRAWWQAQVGVYVLLGHAARRAALVVLHADMHGVWVGVLKACAQAYVLAV